ncbi:MAG: aminopeptidase [Caldilineaceae bacterium]|nr:aminopeptidase [Caldilineaceae bacterium]
MMDTQLEQQRRYAEALVKFGLNLQEGQSLRIGAELEHAPFVRLVVEEAYRQGAPFVAVEWNDTPIARARMQHSRAEYLSYFPDYESAKHRQMLDEGWARLALVGNEFPDLLKDVDPAAMRTVAVTRSQKLKFYMQAMMANQMQWCVAAVPTRAWAIKVYPNLAPDAAVAELWKQVLRMCRVDQADPVAAWAKHNATLKQVADFLMRNEVRSLRFVDSKSGPDGLPATDLTIGLTDRPQWLGGGAERTDGLPFLPNMPTEEVFSTPHNQRAEGYVRLSKPAFPFQREVKDGFFRFAGGEVVEFDAAEGREVLEQFFELDGTRRLGEVALVDVKSPVNQAGVVFYEILFDENAACHIAFGEAYPDGVMDGSKLPEEELRALGVNKADAHLDVMIGNSTMRVVGLREDGSEVVVIEQGEFVPAATQGVPA